MLSWLDRIWHGAEGLIGSGVHAAASLATRGIAAVLSWLTGNVSDAWTDLERAAGYEERELGGWIDDVTGHLWRIITYDIPHYAMTAYWWVTHPADLADVLTWHAVRFLEDHADQAAEYLGRFALALVLRNSRQLVHLAERIIEAVL